MTKSNRIHSLDRLRAFAIVLVVVLHGSITYMAYAPTWWYVIEPENSLFFTALVLLIDVPVMPAMFFIAGYFALPSLAKRGPMGFLKDKGIRIGVPWLLRVLFLAPPITYLTYLSRNVPVGFLEFWGDMYQQAVYWFLGVLFFMFVTLTKIYVYASNRTPHPAKQEASTPSWTLFATFAAVTTGAFLLLNLTYPLDTWLNLRHILMIQPLRVPLYIGYFLLGVYAYKNAWLIADGYKPGLDPWAFLSALSGAIYLSYRLSFAPAAQTTMVLKATNAALFNVFCLSSLITGIAFFERGAHGASSFRRSLAASSFGIYYVHPVFLYPLALIFVSIPVPLFLKAAVVTVLAMLLSWGFSALVLTRAPILRRMF